MDLRLRASLEVGDVTQVDGVLARLSAVCLAQDATLDHRNAAFLSFERGGPNPTACVALLWQLPSDDARTKPALD